MDDAERSPHLRHGRHDSARVNKSAAVVASPSTEAMPRSKPISVAGNASISRMARSAMYCAVHSPIPRIVRSRVTVSSTLPNGRNRFESATAASATAFSAVNRATGMPSPSDTHARGTRMVVTIAIAVIGGCGGSSGSSGHGGAGGPAGAGRGGGTAAAGRGGIGGASGGFGQRRVHLCDISQASRPRDRGR